MSAGIVVIVVFITITLGVTTTLCMMEYLDFKTRSQENSLKELEISSKVIKQTQLEQDFKLLENLQDKQEHRFEKLYEDVADLRKKEREYGDRILKLERGGNK